MNSEIYSILDDMKKHMPKNPIATSDRHTDLSIKNSMLLVLLAEENEKSAKKLEKLTKTLSILTWVIAIFTAFLVIPEDPCEVPTKVVPQGRKDHRNKE